MAATEKDTIYIDIDDEITGIIDKVHASEGKVVALVLPKRAAIFQSIINMKLLKRAADSSAKHLVLITSESGLLPLAGAAGVHVAKSLTSKPEIPLAPIPIDDHEETVSEDAAEPSSQPEITAETAGDQPVGQLAAAAGLGAVAAAGKEDMETLVLDDEDLPPESGLPNPKNFDVPDKPKKGKKGKNKGLRVPNFERFRLLLVLGILLLILIAGGFIFAATALPKATINIDTNAVNVDSNLNLNLSTAAQTIGLGDNTIPAKLVQQQKTYAQQAATTGQKNNGNKATGSISMTASVCPPFPQNLATFQPAEVPAGTGVSANGLTYITQDDTTFNGAGSLPKKSNCITYSADSPTPITAQTGGTSYNGASTFTVAQRSDITASVASAINGGTDSIVQTVNQNDITGAKAKINIDDPTVKQALQDQLKQAGYYAVVITYTTGTPTITTSANVGDVANTVNVTEIVNYMMFGVRQSDLKSLVDNSVKSQIDTSKQTILSEGLDNAKFSVTNASATGAQIAMTTVATAGPDLNQAAIIQSAAGQHPGQVQDNLKNQPGVQNVSVKLSPFWVSTIPKKTQRITVNIAKPTASAASSNSNASSP